MLNNIKNLKVKFWQNFGKFLLFLPPTQNNQTAKMAKSRISFWGV